MKQAMDSLKRNKVGLKGILHTPVSKLGHKSFNVFLRKDLDVYASVSVLKNFPGLPSPRNKKVDFAIIRENTEGEYSGLEHTVSCDYSFLIISMWQCYLPTPINSLALPRCCRIS